MATVPPVKDNDLKPWSENLSTRLTATPTVFGCTAGDATALSALVTDYTTRLATAENPSTRTRSNIQAKNVSKKALLAKVRQLIKIISAYPPVTPSQRTDLGLNPKDVTPTPVPPPATKPLLVLASDGSLRVKDETDPERRGRPPGTKGAVVRMKLGATPPAPDGSDLRFAALATRDVLTLPLAPGSVGQTCWVVAQWYNERGQLGPSSDVVSKLIAA
jgi:hypothetical protein